MKKVFITSLLLMTLSCACSTSKVIVYVAPNECIKCINYFGIFQSLDQRHIPYNIVASELHKPDSTYLSDIFSNVTDRDIKFINTNLHPYNKLFYNTLLLLHKDSVQLAFRLKNIEESIIDSFYARYTINEIGSDQYKMALYNAEFPLNCRPDFKNPLSPIFFNKLTGELHNYTFQDSLFVLISNIKIDTTFKIKIYKHLYDSKSDIKIKKYTNKHNQLEASTLCYYQGSKNELHQLVEISVSNRFFWKRWESTKLVLLTHGKQKTMMRTIPHTTGTYRYTIFPYFGFYIENEHFFSNVLPFLASDKKAYIFHKRRIQQSRIRHGKIIRQLKHPKYFIEKGLHYNDNSGLWRDNYFIFYIDPSIYNVTSGTVIENTEMANSPITNQEVMSYMGRSDDFILSRNFVLLDYTINPSLSMIYMSNGQMHFARLENDSMIQTNLQFSIKPSETYSFLIQNQMIILLNKSIGKVDKIISLTRN